MVVVVQCVDDFFDVVVGGVDCLQGWVLSQYLFCYGSGDICLFMIVNWFKDLLFFVLFLQVGVKVDFIVFLVGKMIIVNDNVNFVIFLV